MQVSNQIDKLINNLNNLKPLLSGNQQNNKAAFDNILTNALDEGTSKGSYVTEHSDNINNEISSWIDIDYRYSEDTPRKPNLRELMEAISGKPVEEMYSNTNSNWEDTAKQANDLLYGVVGKNLDTRDWNLIMKASNVQKAAQAATNEMYNPAVDIVEEMDSENNLLGQYAVIKDENGQVLRTLKGNPSTIDNTLRNFGATKESISSNLEEKIDYSLFDIEILNVLKNLPEDKSADSEKQELEALALQSTADAIVSKYSDGIPLEELEKL